MPAVSETVSVAKHMFRPLAPGIRIYMHYGLRPRLLVSGNYRKLLGYILGGLLLPMYLYPHILTNQVLLLLKKWVESFHGAISQLRVQNEPRYRLPHLKENPAYLEQDFSYNLRTLIGLQRLSQTSVVKRALRRLHLFGEAASTILQLLNVLWIPFQNSRKYLSPVKGNSE